MVLYISGGAGFLNHQQYGLILRAYINHVNQWFPLITGRKIPNSHFWGGGGIRWEHPKPKKPQLYKTTVPIESMRLVDILPT